MPSVIRQEKKRKIEALTAAYEVCDQYDRDCQPNVSSCMQPYVDRVEAEMRDLVLTELLAGEIERRRGWGAPCDREAMRVIAGVPDAEFDDAWKKVDENNSDVVLAIEESVHAAQTDFIAQQKTLVGSLDSTKAFDGPTLLTGSTMASIGGGGLRTTSWVADEYEIVDKLGEGGMGVVYRARQHSLNRYVALKIIPGHLLDSAQAVARFYLEAETAGKLDHPNIVPVYEVGERNGVHFYAMALVEGESLRAHVGEGRPRLPARRAVEVMERVARAVQHAHDRAVIHRDIKPANIMLDRQGEPRLTDFGLAKFLEREDDLTVTGNVLGTPAFMAPEQADPTRREISTKADVYAFGATLYSLLAGRAPFTGSQVDILRQVMDVNPPSLRSTAREISLDLQTICERSMAKRQQDRYATAADLADDLQRYLDGYPIAARPVGPWERTVRWCGRNPMIAGLIAAVSLAMIAGTVVSTVFGMVASQEARRANAALATGQDLIEETFLFASEGLKDDAGTQTMRNELLERVQSYYEDLARTNENNPELRRDFAKAQFMLGQARAELDQFDDASEVLTRVLSVQEEMAEAKGAGADDIAAIAFTHQALGRLYENQLQRLLKKGPPNKREQALASKFLTQWVSHSEEARDWRQKAVALAPANVGFSRLLASSMEALAAAHLQQNLYSGDYENSDKALQEFRAAQEQRALAIEQASRDSGGLTVAMAIKREMGRGLVNLANAHLKVMTRFAGKQDPRKAIVAIQQNTAEALALYDEVHTWQLRGGLLERTSESVIRGEAANCQLRHGIVCKQLKQYDAAQLDFEHAIRDMRLVCLRNPQVRQYWSELGSMHANLCGLQLERNDAPSGQQTMDAFLTTIADSLRVPFDAKANAKDHQQWIYDQFNGFMKLSAVGTTNPAMASALFHDAAVKLQQLVDDSPSEFDWLDPVIKRLQESGKPPKDAEAAHKVSALR